MKPTLLIGDYIIVKKFSYGVRIPFSDTFLFGTTAIDRGDVVVFKRKLGTSDNAGKNYFIKRVVAVGGDTVQIRGRSILINGNEVLQTYAGPYPGDKDTLMERYVQRFGNNNVNILYKKGRYSTYKGDISYPLKVPEGHIFLMGDNRDNSHDSRVWGVIAGKNVVGKAVMIHWSWQFKDSLIPQVRWKRIFSEIR